MTLLSERRIPPPRDDKIFEKLCRDLWQRVWNDSSVKLNGRTGQKQDGVDVFGRPNRGKDFAGIQCKAVSSLSETEIREEVRKAKSFTPPLATYIIATTLPTDVHLQAVARTITLENAAEGLFEVTVYGWDDILELLDEYPDLAGKYLEIDIPEPRIIQSMAGLLLDASQRFGSSYSAAISTASVAAAPIGEYHSQLNFVRELLHNSRFATGLEILSKYRDRFWHGSDDEVRYRIAHYEGIALLRLERDQEAAARFLEAVALNPNDENARAYRSLAYLLINDRTKAFSEATRVIADYPTNTVAQEVMIESAPAATTEEELQNYLPEPYRQSGSAAFAFAFRYARAANLAQAEGWARRSLALEKEASGEAHGLLGNILLDKGLGRGGMEPMFRRSAENFAIVTEAEHHFTSAWDKVCQTERAAARVGWLINRAMARRFLGRADEAVIDIAEALRISPHHPEAVPRRALLALDQGEVDYAIKFMRTEFDQSQNYEFGHFLVSMLVDEKRFEEAAPVVTVLAKIGVPADHQGEYGRFRFEVALAQGFLDEAESAAESLRYSGPDGELLAEVCQAKVAASRDKTDKQLDHLDAAMKVVTPTTGYGSLYLLATELRQSGQFKGAAVVLEQLADTDTEDADDPLVRRLLDSYYRGGEEAKALDLVEKLLKKHGPLPKVSELATYLYEEKDDLKAARATAEAYVTKFPEDFSMRLQFGLICYRMDDSAGVDTFIASPIEPKNLSLDDAIRVFHLLMYRRHFERAIDLAYQTLRRFPTEEQAHELYVRLFMGDLLGVDLHGLLMPDTVIVETVVTLREESGKEVWFQITDEPDGRNPTTDLLPDQPLAQKLLGKRVGDAVIVEETEFIRDEAVIINIESKYTRTFNETLNSLQRLFPHNQTVRRIPIGALSQQT